MQPTHKPKQLASKRYFKAWQLTIEPIDITKAAHVRDRLLHTSIEKTSEWMPMFCPIAFAIKRSGRFNDVRVYRTYLHAGGHLLHLNEDVQKLIKLWDAGQSIDPCTIEVYEEASSEIPT